MKLITEIAMEDITINFFEKNTGLRDLQKIYSLTDDQISRIEDRAFEYEVPPLSEEEIENIIEDIKEALPYETTESCEAMRQYMADRSRVYRIPVDDCVQIFLEEAQILPDVYKLNKVKIHCKHFASVIDGGQSIMQHGLLRLDQVLVKDTPLRKFLKDRRIEILPEEHIIKINDKSFAITPEDRIGRANILYVKLYKDLGETEVFINGEHDEMLRYSVISRAPEILYTLDQSIKGQNLEARWAEKKTDLIEVDFDVCLDEIVIHTMRERDDDFDRFLSRKYETIPFLVWQHYWIIENCLRNSTQKGISELTFAAIKPNVKIGPERLVITVV